MPDELSNRVAKTGLRWLALIPATMVTWALTTLLAFGFLAIAFRLCPQEQLVSGACTGPWYRHAEDAVVFGWAVLFGALTVAVAAVIAPSYRAHVATIAFIAGAALLLHLAFLLGWWGPLSAGLFACAISWLGVLRWERKRARSNT